MAIVSFEELKAQARITDDAPSADIFLLQAKGEAAQQHVERLLGFRFADRFAEGATPEPLREAVLQLACWWFENRETVSDREGMLPYGVGDIVTEYRDWSF